MNELPINTVFQPKSSKQEAKADVTTRVSREIMDSETAAREAKTERLRAARLVLKATANPVAETPKKMPRKR